MIPRRRRHHHKNGRMGGLVVVSSCAVVWLFCVAAFTAKLLPFAAAQQQVWESPQVHWRVPPPTSFGTDMVVRENRVVVDDDNERVYFTTLRGKVLTVPLHNQNNNPNAPSTIWYDTPSRGSLYSLSCLSGLALYRPSKNDDNKKNAADPPTFVIFAVLDSGPSGMSSRILLVPTNSDGTATTADSDAVRTIPVNGIIKGTPVVRGHHLFVVQHVAGDSSQPAGQRLGQLTIFDLSNLTGDQKNNNDAPTQVVSVPEDGSAGILAPPALTTVILDDGREVDWIVLAENLDQGTSQTGALYAVRFHPATQQAVWHVVSSDIRGSSRTAPVVSPDGTTIVVGQFRNTVRAWINNANLRALLHYGEESSSTDNNIQADWNTKLTKSDNPVVAQPVLVLSNNDAAATSTPQPQQVLVPDQEADLVALDLQNGNENWKLSTFTGHATHPVVVAAPNNNGNGPQSIVYDLSLVGLVRQVVWDATTPTVLNHTYTANCQGRLSSSQLNSALVVTQNQCGSASAQAEFAVTSNGAFVLYATTDGTVTALQVADDVAIAPPPPSTTTTPRPTTPPPTTAAPTTPVPSATPSAAPTTAAPTTLTPTTSPRPTSGTDSPTAPTPVPTTLSPSQRPVGARTTTPPQSTTTNTAAPVVVSTEAPVVEKDDNDNTTNDGTTTTNEEEGDDDGTTNPNQVGLGTNPNTNDDNDNSSLGVLAIALGAVAGLLFCTVLAAVHFIRSKRHKEKMSHLQQQQQAYELQVQKSFDSSRLKYEEEMRLEEEETLNDLLKKETRPDRPEHSQQQNHNNFVLPLSKRRHGGGSKKGNTRRGWRRGGGTGNGVGGATLSLGSISESEHEDPHYHMDECDEDYVDEDEQVSDAEESGYGGAGFEISLDALEQGAAGVGGGGGIQKSSTTPAPSPRQYQQEQHPRSQTALPDFSYSNSSSQSDENNNNNNSSSSREEEEEEPQQQRREVPSISPIFHQSSSPATPQEASPPPADNQSRWFAEILSLRPSLFDSSLLSSSKKPASQKEEKRPDPVIPAGVASSPSQSSTASSSRYRGISSPLPVPEEDEEEPGLIIPAVRPSSEQTNQNTFVPRVLTPTTPPLSPQPQQRTTASSLMPRSPSGNMSLSGIVSVDSSLYIEGSTVANTTNFSPPGGASVMSSKSQKSQRSAASKQPPQEQQRLVIPPLSPPDGASVTSDASSRRSAVATPPGAHYFKSLAAGDDSQAPRGGGGRIPPLLNNSHRGFSPNPDLEDPDMDDYYQSRERALTPKSPFLSTNDPRRSLTYEQVDSPRSPRGSSIHVGTSLPAYTSRAGLFSRRQQQQQQQQQLSKQQPVMDRLLPQYESDATASETEGEERSYYGQASHQRRQHRQPPSHLTMPEPRRRPSGASSSKKTKKKNDSDSLSPAASVASGGSSAGSAVSPYKKHNTSGASTTTTTTTTSVWNSFLSELSKAEKQFFNPTTTTSNSGTPESDGDDDDDHNASPRPDDPKQKQPQSRKTAVPPPPPRRDSLDSSIASDSRKHRNYYSRDHSPEPPPPPPSYQYAERRPSRPRNTVRRSDVL